MWTNSGITGKKFLSWMAGLWLTYLFVSNVYWRGVVAGIIGTSALVVLMDVLIHGCYVRLRRLNVRNNRYDAVLFFHPRRFRESYYAIVSLDTGSTISCVPLRVLPDRDWPAFNVVRLLTASKHIDRILILGGGGGALAKMLFESKKPMSMDVVEISPEFINIATRVFHVSDPSIRYLCEDAFKFLRRNKEQYDLIFVDVFNNIVMDARVCQPRYVSLMKKSLREGGSIIINLGFSQSTTPYYSVWSREMRIHAYQERRNIYLSNILADISLRGIKTVYQSYPVAVQPS